MPNMQVINLAGEVVRDITLNPEVFGIEPNQQVIFDAVVMQRASMRQGTHDVKNRREVRGGGRKPYRQKGTGNARQGSIRAPQWRGGGVVFGVTPRSYTFKMNKKERVLALRSALTDKVKNNELVYNGKMSSVISENRKLIDEPEILRFINLANKRGAKLDLTLDSKELLKDIYRSVY